MSATVIWGTDVASEIRGDLKKQIDLLKDEHVVPGLAVILVGNHPASRSYVKGKEKACKEVGIYSELIELEENTSEQDLLQLIEELNNRSEIDGILVQLPLPNWISEEKVIQAISPSKDVDGFHPMSVGKMMTGQKTFLPCTPFGVMKMLESQNIEVAGKHAVVIGRSNIVGKPIGQLLLNENATVTYCHSKTKNMKELTKQADILIVAVGKEKLIDSTYVKEGAVVIDVGVNRNEEGKLCGDVDFEDVSTIASYITPVPKGVGPMTITMLFYNTVLSAQNRAIASNR